jgi:hypothetical protein
MALQVASGTITLTTGAIGTTFAVSGLPWDLTTIPTFIFLFWSGRATTGQGEANHKFGAGFAVSPTSERAYTSQSEHASGSADTDRAWHDDCCVSTLTVDGGLDGKAALDALTTDGFRLIIADVFSADLQVGWIAIGGSALEFAIVDFISPAATGDQDYNAGLALNTGLDDKAVIFLGGPVSDAGVPNTFSQWMLGAAAGDTPVNAVLAGTSDQSAGTSITGSYCLIGECIATLYTDVIRQRASLTTWLSTGFRLNWAEIPPFLVRHSALVIKGERWQIGDSLTSTGTTNQTEATDYIPKALLIASHGKAQSTSDAVDAGDERIVGVAVSPTSRQCAAVLDKDAAPNMDIGIAFSETAMYVNQSIAAAIVQEGAMDLVSFDATPGFTYVMDDADPAAAFFWYLLAAEAAGTPVSRAAAVSLESLTGPASDRSSSLEALISVAQGRAALLESLSSVSQPRVESLEALTGVAQTATAPLEALAQAVAARGVSLEALTALAQARVLLLESLESIAQASTENIEALQGVAAARTLNLEALGQILVSMTAVIPLEALSDSRAARVIGLESLAPAAREIILTLESLIGVMRAASGSIEVLVGVRVERSANIEGLAALAGTATSPGRSN